MVVSGAADAAVYTQSYFSSPVFHVAYGVIGVSILHWFVINLYAYFCAHPSLVGALKSFVTMGSPTCQFLNKVQYELTSNFALLITTLASTLLSAIKTRINT